MKKTILEQREHTVYFPRNNDKLDASTDLTLFEFFGFLKIEKHRRNYKGRLAITPIEVKLVDCPATETAPAHQKYAVTYMILWYTFSQNPLLLKLKSKYNLQDIVADF